MHWLLPLVSLFLVGQPSDLAARAERWVVDSAVRARDIQQRERSPEAHHKASMALARELFDARGFAEAALRRSWPDLSPEDRPRLVARIETLLSTRFAARIDPRAAFTLTVDSSTVRRGVVIVSTRVAVGQRRRSVELVLRPRGEGFGVIDVALDGVSLLRNYRSVFTKTMRTRGLKGLIERIDRGIAKAASPSGG